MEQTKSEQVHSIVYVVHRGFASNDKGERGLANPVCTRLNKEDAETVAGALNDAQEGVFYLRFVASNGFNGYGNADALFEKAAQDDFRTAWEKIATPLREEAQKRGNSLYQVTALGTRNANDAIEIQRMVDAGAQQDARPPPTVSK